MSKQSVGVFLFPDFELLDVCGPLEMLGMNDSYFEIHTVAEKAGPITSRQGPELVAKHGFDTTLTFDILLVPGGIGTRTEVDRPVTLNWLKVQSEKADYVASVCTGSALLAKAGILDGIHATTNKMAYHWATGQSDKVLWKKEARWVEDGKFFTSSGVSAGMDMSLALISRLLGKEVAEQIAIHAEYQWHTSADCDPFAKIHGLGVCRT